MLVEMWFKFKMLATFFTTLASGANILGIIPSPSYSHQVAFFDLWAELSLRGHKVTVITTDPQKNEKLTNLTEIDMKWTYKLFENSSKERQRKMNMWNFHIWLYNVSVVMPPAQLSHHQVQDLIHNKKHFDVLLLQAYYPEFLGFAEIYNCPTILVSSLDVFPNIHYKMGNPLHPVSTPIAISRYYLPSNFQERLISTLYVFYSTLFNKYIAYPAKEKIMQTFFNTTSTIDQLLDKVDMLFHNLHPVINSAKAIGPSTINTCNLRRVSIKPLPKDLKDFLDSATSGFVYFSLGSNVKSKYLHEESLKSIVGSLGELPCKVLWKFEAEPDTMPNKPTNIKLITWAPQLAVLAHPNIKVFVTQGGLQSMEETIYNEVPCVVIPFVVDQEQNAKLMKTKGFATIVDGHPYIKKEELKSAILEVLNNSKYKDAVKELKRLALDTPMTGLERAIWWTEYVIRNKGAKHLRNPTADLPFYQYYLLDVVGFLLAVTMFTIVVSFLVFKKVYSSIRIVFLRKLHVTSKKLQ